MRCSTAPSRPAPRCRRGRWAPWPISSGAIAPVSVIDPEGYTWTIATHKEDLTPEEMQQRMDDFMKNMPGGRAPVVRTGLAGRHNGGEALHFGDPRYRASSA